MKVYIFPLVILIWGGTEKARAQFPDIGGYQTLKCDFHMHTVFSDGHVWPSFRVQEALRDSLDAIAITEHIDYEGYPDEIERDLDKSFEIASERAEGTGLILIKGVEISPRVPPYHCNALFIQEANKIPFPYMKSAKQEFVMKEDMTREELMAPFEEVKRQGGFVFYNHPNYRWWDGKRRELFTDFHQELMDMGILKGVEVINSGRYLLHGHRFAAEYGLTMFANSDEHYDVSNTYAGTHRPLTLVFAETRTPEGIREALEEGRTALYADDYLIGRKREMEAFFKASLEVSCERKEEKRTEVPLLEVKIRNNSKVPYEVKLKADYDIQSLPLGRTVLAPHDTTTIILDAVWEYPEKTVLQVTAENIFISPEEVLQTELEIKP